MKLSAREFMSSLDVDKDLYKEEIECSIAHARMLGKQGLITKDEAEQIIQALKEVLDEIKSGKRSFTSEYADVHEAVQAFVIDKIGCPGRKLKMARSVNDQVVADSRLFLKKETLSIEELLKDLLDTLETLAKEHVNTIMPGYSHMQRAQPVTLAYHILAYYQMFSRDMKRFQNCLEGIDMFPPDSGALAGTTFETDRSDVMKELGFSAMLPNAMDAISDRDFGMEFINCCAIAITHLSRFCEDIILWDTVEFNFIEIADEFTTSSRWMPEKKNLDVAEIIRGSTGKVYGDLINLLTIFKGLPMSYNRDMQLDKQPVIDAAHTLESSLNLFVQMIKTIKINRGEMQRAAKYGYMNASEIAKYLISKGIDADECPAIIDRIVKYSINNGKPVDELWLDDLKQFSPVFDSDFYDAVAIRNVIQSKKSVGSTSFDSVEAQLKQIEAEKK